jgi:crotonobetaine/carnitine-CoA ligase
MIEYYRDPKRTAEAKRDGWIYTGDVGYRDESGYIYFVGRKKEVLRRRGELIDPVEIEAVINQHPKIEASAVVGVPSGYGVGEEEVKAYIQWKPGEICSPQEIWDWCSQRMADFKVPRFLEFISELPRTATWKIQKSALKGAVKDLTEGCYDRLKNQGK